MYVLGVDPGPVPGLVRLELATVGEDTRLIDAVAVQVSPPAALFTVLHALRDRSNGDQTLAYERFVVGRRSARSATPHAGAITRDMAGSLDLFGREYCRSTHPRATADVKPWAIDKRLHASGLLDLTAGMRHARDAARHALFCAVRDYGLPDPLSSKAAAR